MPNNKSEDDNNQPELYQYSWRKGNLVDPITKSVLNVIGTIHTHLAAWGTIAEYPPSGEDQDYFALHTPNKPYLTIGRNGLVYGGYGNRFNGKYDDTKMAFDYGGVPRVCISTLRKGFDLRAYLIWYMKIVAKIDQ